MGETLIESDDKRGQRYETEGDRMLLMTWWGFFSQEQYGVVSDTTKLNEIRSECRS